MVTDIGLPTLGYPPELPIVDRRDELVKAIADNQVLIVAGETGSGKSTQLPKICVEAGRGVDKLIGHTQPRRLAARSIAERIAAETETEVGGAVGFAVRFNDRVGSQTRIKLMTDGILLAEIQRDRSLRRYDTLIIDEAHERSLNIDFILGYLRQLIDRRPDLHLIVTSATIDTDRFSTHFGGAPIIEVSGRTYPVDVRYRPIDGTDPAAGPNEPLSQPDAIVDAVRDLSREGPGDMLVFLAGERDIRETADALLDAKLSNTEVFPLYARLSSAEQHRVFQAHRGRRIVLATNVAETSVTVPGIRYVIDPGNARISRYNLRTKVQRLPIEPVSQASADQRAGRCGRVGPGICLRLYAEDDYNARPEFTEPEIRRTNLASVILQMASLGLGDISSFPFVEPPDDRSITDGIQLLEELDALDPERHGTNEWLTPMGRELAQLPVDPRFGRMLIEAADHGALREVSIIVAGLSIIDPRERPTDRQQEADESHRRFVDERSDFLTFLELWRYLQQARSDNSSGQFRRLCRREFLNYNRVREWEDVHTQLRKTTKQLGYRASGNDAEADTIHRCVLAGLLSHIGMKEPDRKGRRNQQGGNGGQRRKQNRAEFVGARNTKFAVAPGSALAKRAPAWIMAAELVETNRMWARSAGPIDPSWAEDLGHYLVKRSYGEPTWDGVNGVARTTERVTLYGLPLVEGRKINVGRVDPALARELFIHHALVEGDWDASHAFIEHNRTVVDDVEELQRRTRRRDLLADHQIRHDFFDARLPDHVHSGRHFDRWWKKVKDETPDLLSFSVDDLLSSEAHTVDVSQFPDVWRQGELELDLAYEFDTDSQVDGVSVHVPVELLNQLDPRGFEWTVPGFRSELLNSLIRSLPKTIRKQLLPISETVEAMVAELNPPDGILIERLRTALGRRAGTVIPADAFAIDRIPPHLRPTFRVINERFEVLAEGKDLGALAKLMSTQVRAALSEVASSTSLERTGLRTWEVDEIPMVVDTPGPSHTVRAYPSLVDEEQSVAIRLHPTEEEQADAMWLGTRRLIRLQLPNPVRQLDELLDDRTKLQLATAPVQSKAQWYNDGIDCAIDEAIAQVGGPAWTRRDFERLLEQATTEVPVNLARLAELITELVRSITTIGARLKPTGSTGIDASVRDIQAHLDRLAYPGFLAGVGFDRVADVARYLEAIVVRVGQLAEHPSRDLTAAVACVEVEQQHARLVAKLGLTPQLEAVTWQLEELRVNQFALHLRGTGKVSTTRIGRKLAEIERTATS